MKTLKLFLAGLFIIALSACSTCPFASKTNECGTKCEKCSCSQCANQEQSCQVQK